MCLGLLVCAVSIVCASAGPSAQTPVDLQTLTVPAERLPAGCALRPDAPADPQPAVVQADGALRVRTSRTVAFSAPENPWSGSDRRTVVTLRRLIEPSPELPDAPPLTMAERSELERRWVEHVTDGYWALYESPEGAVEVVAIAFDDPKLAAASPSVRDQQHTPSATSARILLNNVVVALRGASSGACFEAVAAHVRSLQ